MLDLVGLTVYKYNPPDLYVAPDVPEVFTYVLHIKGKKKPFDFCGDFPKYPHLLSLVIRILVVPTQNLVSNLQSYWVEDIAF